jgi:hypothetical protein
MAFFGLIAPSIDVSHPADIWGCPIIQASTGLSPSAKVRLDGARDRSDDLMAETGQSARRNAPMTVMQTIQKGAFARALRMRLGVGTILAVDFGIKSAFRSSYSH